MQQAANWTDLVDIRYQVGKTLTNVRVLAKQVTAELNEQGFTTVPDADSSVVHFALYYLKHSLIQLHFSIQKQFKASLSQTTTIEDFYVLDLEEPLSTVQQLEYVGKYKKVEKTNSIQLKNYVNDNIEIENIEVALRKLIINDYAINGVNDFKKVVPSTVQDKINAALEREQKKNPALVDSKNNSPEYLLQFTDLQELQTIIVNKANWEKVQHQFGTKENLAIEFNNLSGLRNAIRHTREVDEVTFLKGKAAIEWFKQQLRI